MQLGNERESGNVEDRRGLGIGGVGGGIGIGGVVIALIAYFLGIDPTPILNGMQQSAPPQNAQVQQREPAHDETTVFVRKVLASTEDVWTSLFRDMKRPYHDPKLVLYSNMTRTACGTGQAAMGPFYCPNDERLYLDTAFFNDLQRRFHAPGDFAQAYVVAHEVGHHVQKQLGIMDRMESLRGRVSKAEMNSASVRLELQADCFAGVWGHYANNEHLLDPGDLDEGLAAASAVGDDRLQKQAQGYVVPESFTHGSSAQRTRWFKRGMETGQISSCNTFESNVL